MPNNPFLPTPSDRFETTWSSPLSPDALRFSATHSNYSYAVNQYTHPSNIVEFNGVEYNVSRLARANRRADQEERDIFAEDVGLTTELRLKGSGTENWWTAGGKWWLATRGMKLRLLVQDLSLVEKHLKEQKAAKRAIEELLTPTQVHTFATNLLAWEHLQASISLLYSIKWLLEKLHELVLDEVRAGWDWREGLKAQMLLKSVRDCAGQEGPSGVWGLRVGMVGDTVEGERRR